MLPWVCPGSWHWRQLPASHVPEASGWAAALRLRWRLGHSHVLQFQIHDGNSASQTLLIKAEVFLQKWRGFSREGVQSPWREPVFSHGYRGGPEGQVSFQHPQQESTE